jgi:hypothetical protein
MKNCHPNTWTKSKHKVDTRLFSTHGVWGIREAAFGNNGKTKTGIILEQHVIQ